MRSDERGWRWREEGGVEVEGGKGRE